MRGLRRRLRRPSPAMVVALVALFAALGGQAVARVLLGTKNLKNGAVTSAKIRNRTIKTIDIARGVLPLTYTKPEADARFVNKVPGTLNEAPNSAQLGGKDASQYYDSSAADARFVNRVPGTVNEAPNSAQLEGHPSGDFVLGGGQTHIARLVLDPASDSQRHDLITMPGLGTFAVYCNSAGPSADLSFTRANADNIGLFSQRTLDPPGPSNTATELATAVVSGDAPHAFAAVGGDGAIARFIIQLSRVTDSGPQIGTAIISLTYNDADLQPGKCFAEAETFQNAG